MNRTRDNHFVPQWYQKGFMDEGCEKLCHLKRLDIPLPDGSTKTVYSQKWQTAAQRFYEKDLYSTFFGEEVNDEIERKLFGPIDDNGSKAIRAFLTNDQSQWHHYFQDFFVYLDAQKLRTPKGLDWVASKYPDLNQLQLMMEMQALRSMHVTLWSEGVRELVSAEDSDIKFIVSDHPVTVYNHACSPESELCKYPSDPDISLNGSQTIFPLDKNWCLILTNLDYAKDPEVTNPVKQRINATRIRRSMVKTIEFIRSRKLSAADVTKINHVIKSRAHLSVAAGREEWLYPEKNLACEWSDIKTVLLPPSDELYKFGGELYAKFEDGSVYYQDAYGRTSNDDHLKKDIDEKKLGRNEPCGCGSGIKYKHCCRGKSAALRTTWEVASIRERNLTFCNCIRGVLGLDQGKTWLDVRRDLSDEQVREIYGFYSALWPRETDVYAMLPKPDGKFRGLYTGQVDIRVIGTHALPMASMFDEFLIQTPIVNPNNLREEHNPLKVPGDFKYQALKDILFMLELEPFIGAGLVNLVPDPGHHDLELLRAMMTIARERGGTEICKSDERLHFELMTQDLIFSTAMMPKTARINVLEDQLHLPREEAEKIINALDENPEASPLMALQKLGPGGGSQYIQCAMGPNFEMALFLGQVTGSVLVTDSDTRWQQLVRAQHRRQGFARYPWAMIQDQFQAIPLDFGFTDTLQRSGPPFSQTRNLLKSFGEMVIRGDHDSERTAALAGEAALLSKSLDPAGEKVPMESLKILSPEGGFYDIKVQRLLARSSCTNYQDHVKSIYGVGLTNRS